MRLALPRFALGAALLLLGSPLSFAAPKIGVLLKGRSPFWSSMEKGATEAGQKLGVEVIVKAPVAETDVSVQIALLNALGNQGIEALVIAPCSKEALAAPVAALAAKGIKIVVIDSPLDGKAASVFVATDHQAAGTAAGRLIASLVGETDDVSFLKHSQTSGATLVRESAALAALRELHPKVSVFGEIYASAEKDMEVQKANLLLETRPKTKAILATGTPGSMAMLRVLNEKKLAGQIKLVGCGFNLNPDVASAIDSGAMAGWIAQLPQDVGSKGVEAAVSLLKGESVPATVHTDFVAVTKDNLKDPKVQALLSL